MTLAVSAAGDSGAALRAGLDVAAAALAPTIRAFAARWERKPGRPALGSESVAAEPPRSCTIFGGLAEWPTHRFAHASR
jgi:hypothetical protein